MIRLTGAVVAVLLLGGAFSAATAEAPGGSPGQMATRWVIEPIDPPAGERLLASKEYVLKQRLLPTGLMRLPRAVGQAEAGAELAAGTELIEVKSTAGIVFCEGQIRSKKMIGGRLQVCFLDGDFDGRLESTFRSSSQAPALVMIGGLMPKKRMALAAPIAIDRADPATSQLGTFVAIERRNFFNIYSRESFMILFGSSEQQERITWPVQFKAAEMPKELDILGARFTALRETGGRMAIRVDQAMPAQPFGVIQTMSYR